MLVHPEIASVSGSLDCTFQSGLCQWQEVNPRSKRLSMPSDDITDTDLSKEVIDVRSPVFYSKRSTSERQTNPMWVRVRGGTNGMPLGHSRYDK